MSQITSVTFATDPPETYDECWNANVANTRDVMGYLAGTEVVIAGERLYANPRCAYMFAAHNSYGDTLWSNLVTINGLDLLDTSQVESMKMMFAFTRLTEINGIENWDVSNVRTFAGMFQGNDHAGDIGLKYVDVSKWDTSSAVNMSHVFYGCSQMEYIPIENWNVSNVTTFSHMFADCFGLKTIDFSKWDTCSAESFDGFLNDCRSLISIDVSALNTKSCRQFSQMFESCVNLEQIVGIESWDVSNASYYAFTEMFHRCHKLKSLDIGSWKASPDNTARMFKDCFNLEVIDLSGIDLSNTVHMEEMFSNFGGGVISCISQERYQE